MRPNRCNCGNDCSESYIRYPIKVVSVVRGPNVIAISSPVNPNFKPGALRKVKNSKRGLESGGNSRPPGYVFRIPSSFV